MIQNDSNPTSDSRIQEAGDDLTSKNRLTETGSQVSRRRLLVAGTSTAAAVITSCKSSAAPPQLPGNAVNQGDSSTSPPFGQPRRVEALNGELSHRMNVAVTELRVVCDGKESVGRVPAYNQAVPGASLYIDPGSVMNIELINELQIPNDRCDPAVHNEPGCFSHTNLHTHGLMVSPCSVDKSGTPVCTGPKMCQDLAFSSDDVLVDVPPGCTHRHCIVLPDFHAPGTYWYHAHRHGSTAFQGASGMAGAIIIREPAGQELVPTELDKVWLMQELIFDRSGEINPALVYGAGILEHSAGFFVNGLCKPTLQMSTGQTQRWRFVNATGWPRGLVQLRLVKCSDDPNAVCDDSIPPPGNNIPMHLIAVDGISFYGFKPQPVEQHLMAPGNRADFLINIPRGGKGKYKLVKDQYPADATDPNSGIPAGGSAFSQQVLAFVEVFESTFDEELPSIIPGPRPFYLQPITNVDTIRTTPVSFEVPQPRTFHINGKPYDPNRVDITVPLNTSQQWTLENKQRNAPSPLVHPYHIHVNPFQLVGHKIDPNEPDEPFNWMWMDTVGIPAGTFDNPGTLTINSRFLVYNGEYVLHCHMHAHEDLGMMQNVLADGDGVPPCTPLSDPTGAAVQAVRRSSAPRPLPPRSRARRRRRP